MFNAAKIVLFKSIIIVGWMFAVLSPVHAHPLDELQDEAYQPSAPKMLDLATALERDGRVEIGFYVDAAALLNGEFLPSDVSRLSDDSGKSQLLPEHVSFIKSHVRALVELYANEAKQSGDLVLRELKADQTLPENGKVWAQFSFPSIDKLKTLTLVVNARVSTVRIGIINAEDGSKSRLVRLVEGDTHAALLRGEVIPPHLETRAQALRTLLYPEEKMSVIVMRYLHLGFIHILPRGLDHILFVLALFLLAVRFKPLIVQVSIFTLAHTLTLGLSVVEIITLPASIVEPLIALSICYVAAENYKRSELNHSRMIIIFCFGLLHGMGFAGVLNELGLPSSHLFTALIAFNVGVEIGQLAVILLALGLVGWFRNTEWFRPRVVKPVSLLIAATGLFWTVERVIA